MHIKLQAIANKKAFREAKLNTSMSVLEGINSQIKTLRSMMMNIDDRSTRIVANRVSEMKTSIICGSVYPLQNLKSASLFFAS